MKMALRHCSVVVPAGVVVCAKLESRRAKGISSPPPLLTCGRNPHTSPSSAEKGSHALRASPHGSAEGPQQPRGEGDIAADRDLTLAVASLSRRFLLGVSASSVVALGGNLAGITSFLLGLNAGFSRSLKLDVVYPINGFKRCFEKNFEFLYPDTWVGDQRLLYRAAERAEKQRLYGEAVRTKTSISSLVEPVVAFGPPGSSGELNVSVIVAPIPRDFRLDKLGDPKEAGEVILKSFISNSKVTPALLHAEQSEEWANGEKLLYYNLEFLVQGQSFLRHNISVYAAYNGQLFSMNAQTPENLWPDVKKQFVEMAMSFRVRS